MVQVRVNLCTMKRWREERVRMRGADEKKERMNERNLIVVVTLILEQTLIAMCVSAFIRLLRRSHTHRHSLPRSLFPSAF